MIFDKSAEYYDLMYKDKYDNQTEKEVDYIIKTIKKYKPNSKFVIDAGCGTGRHAKQIAKKGFKIIGYDLSPHMIEVANRRNFDNTSRFMVGDLKTFKYKEKADAIYSFFQSTSYLSTYEELEQAFNSASKQLKPNGLFIFDLWYTPAIIHFGCPSTDRLIKTDYGFVRRKSENFINYKNNSVTINFLFTGKEFKKNFKFKEKHTMSYYTIPEIENLIKGKFKILKIEEAVTRKKPSEKTWAITYICKKVKP